MINPFNITTINKIEQPSLAKENLKPSNLDGRSVNLNAKKLSSAHKVALCFGTAALVTGVTLAARYYLTIKNDSSNVDGKLIFDSQTLKSDAATNFTNNSSNVIILDNQNLKSDTVTVLPKTVIPQSTMEMALKLKDAVALEMDKNIVVKVYAYVLGGVVVILAAGGIPLGIAEMLIRCGYIRIGCGGGDD